MRVCAPRYVWAGFEYRFALDAAASILGGEANRVVCQAAELEEEVFARFPDQTKPGNVNSGLWVEPQVVDWIKVFAAFHTNLSDGGRLVVVHSLPLAACLPERRGWERDALGLKPNGIGILKNCFKEHGLAVQVDLGFHSPMSMIFNLFSRVANSVGRADLADRWFHYGRDTYTARGAWRKLCTVGLLVCHRKGAG